MFVLAMRLRPLVAAATLAVTAGSAAPASARILGVGRTHAAPACPASPCLALSRTTGYQARMTYSTTLVTDPMPTERGSGGR